MTKINEQFGGHNFEAKEMMFVAVPYILIDNMQELGLTGEHMALLMKLWRHRNFETGLCCPRIQTIADNLGWGKSTVEKRLRELRSMGYVETQKITLDKSQTGYESNAYTFNGLFRAMAALSGVKVPKAKVKCERRENGVRGAAKEAKEKKAAQTNAAAPAVAEEKVVATQVEPESVVAPEPVQEPRWIDDPELTDLHTRMEVAGHLTRTYGRVFESTIATPLDVTSALTILESQSKQFGSKMPRGQKLVEALVDFFKYLKENE